MITKIAYQNFKGASAAYDLSAHTLITGSNFSGKSTLLQAIVLACNGTLPELGKTNAATFQLASAGGMTVQAAFSDGETIVRNWKQSGKQIRSSASGTAPAVSILNGHAFTAATTPARLAMLAATAGGDWNDLEATMATARKCWKIATEGETPLEHAENLIEALKEQATAARARADQFKKTLAGLVELSTDPVSKPEDLSPATRSAHAVMLTARAQEEAAEKIAQQCENARMELQLWLETSEAPTAPADPAELARLQRETFEAFTVARSDLRALEREISATEANISDATFTEADAAEITRLVALATEHFDIGSRVEAGRDKLASIGTQARDIATRLQRAEKELAEFDSLQCCPTCGAAEEGWKATVGRALRLRRDEEKAAAAHIASQLEAQTTINETNRAIQEQLKHLPALRFAETAAAKAMEAKAALTVLREQATTAQQALDALEAKTDQLKEQAENRAEQASDFAKFQELQAAAAATDDAINAAKAAMVAASNAEDAYKRAQDAEAAALIQRDAWQAQLAREQDLIKARKEAEDEAEKVAGLTTATKEIEATLATTLRQLYGPVIEMAEYFSKGVLTSPLTLHPTTGQIGRYHDGGGFIAYGVMSGAEQLVAMASLQAALATAGSGILLLDEMARMDRDTKGRFLAKINEALDNGMIKQAILVDLEETGSGYDGWQSIIPEPAAVPA